MKFNKYKLHEVATIDFSGIDKKSKPDEKSVKLCNFVDVYYNWAITQNMVSGFMEATAKDAQIVKLKLRKGQVALTKDSETRDDIGISTYIADDFEDTVVLGYHNALVTPNPTLLEGKYLNAYLHTKMAQEYFSYNASGSGQRYALSVRAVNDFQIYLPDLESQKKIGHLLSIFDRKIELNKQLNRNLEAMAKQLYDYWFVQFDFPNEEGKPYKSSGGKMVWNDILKREIPEGWIGNDISVIAEILSGGTPSKAKAEYWNGDIPFFGPTDCNGNTFQTQTAEKITEKGLANCSSLKYEVGTIFITARGSIGKCIVTAVPMAMNQSCYALRAKKENRVPYLYFITKQLIEHLKVKGAGSVFKSIIASDIKSSNLAIGNDSVIDSFCCMVSPMFETIKNNTIEIDNLTAQRNELLPLLMNGQVSVMQLNSDLFVLLLILYKAKIIRQ